MTVDLITTNGMTDMFTRGRCDFSVLLMLKRRRTVNFDLFLLIYLLCSAHSSMFKLSKYLYCMYFINKTCPSTAI